MACNISPIHKSKHFPIDQLVCVGNYELEKTIGTGNFAVVKLATHVITKSKVRTYYRSDVKYSGFCVLFTYYLITKWLYMCMASLCVREYVNRVVMSWLFSIARFENFGQVCQTLHYNLFIASTSDVRGARTCFKKKHWKP